MRADVRRRLYLGLVLFLGADLVAIYVAAVELAARWGWMARR